MPTAVLLLSGAILAVAGLGYLSPEFGNWVFAACVVIAADPGMALPSQPLGHAVPYVLHVFLHFGLLHLAMNLAVIVGAGRPVGLAFGTGIRGSSGFLVLFFLCAAGGAGLQVLMHSGDLMTMGGASSGASGLLAAVGWVMGGWRGMLRLAVPWIGLNLLGAFTGLVIPVPVGWFAHVGGTVTGAVLTPVLLGLFGERRA
ncbi:rhomboid family intramembrane serine protease [Maricaulis sp.]|jgi:membrane associated rhomboid family serine protease|uniref:rhomboid family intramembrane serine protease n=1 Tax=Maricaulis sp. TaxID=1486257 RepID=UPI00262413E8|nr:rhomboid family intramembrane serine protease [Maricaulis sp.]